VVVYVGMMVWTTAALPAFGHAALRETTPFEGEVVDEAPMSVTLVFNESVSSPVGALRVFDTGGARADTGQQQQPAQDTVAVSLRDALEDGSYLVSYRVLSEDGHVIRGAFVFSIGSADPVDQETLAALFAGGDGPWPLVAGILRGLVYAGAFVAGGAALWLLRLADGQAERTRTRRWVRRGAILTGIATVLALPVQAMLSSGLGVDALVGPVMIETLTSSVGVAAVVRVVGAVLVLVLLTSAPAAVAAALVMLGSFLLDGHTRTAEPMWLLWVADAIHVVAAAAWVGGLVVLASSLRDRRREDDPSGAAAMVAGFSGIAMIALIVVTAAGLAMSWALVRQPRALTSTDYGWTLAVKVGLVAVLALVGAYNRRQLVPAVSRTEDDQGADAAWASMRRTVRFEVVGVALVIGVTAFLVNLRPAAESAGITGAFDTVVAVGDDLSVNLVVDPNRVGVNELHLYVFDATGRPTGELADVTVNLTHPERDIGPIERVAFVAGAGHWQVDGRDFAVPGRWVVEVVIGVDRFTTVTTEVEVVVNP